MHIDWWTLGFQTVNVAVLVWLLRRFFWRPVAAMIDQRGAATRKALADAKATEDKATAALAAVEKTRAGFAVERAAILTQAHDDAGRANAATLADTARRVAALEAAGAAAIATGQKADQAAWEERSAALAVDIAARLAARLDGAAVQASFLGWLLARLRALPEAARQATKGVALDVVTAAPIGADDQTRTTGLIAEALGATPVLTYRTDPAVIAGLELHGPDLAVTSSWRADLAKIRAAGGHDDGR